MNPQLRVTLAPADDLRSLAVHVSADRAVSLALPIEVANIPLHDLLSSPVLHDDDSPAHISTASHAWLGVLRTAQLSEPGSGIRYRVDIADAHAPRPRGPSYDLRGTPGGFVGALIGAVALPLLEAADWDVLLQWDLPPGFHAASSRGAEDVRWTADAFTSGMVFVGAGDLHTWSSDQPQGFNAHWFAPLPFDADAAFTIADRALHELRRRLEVDESRSYTLLIRPGSIFRDAGAATRNGFILEHGTLDHTLAGRAFMFVHEIAHHFAGTLAGDLSTIAWFAEGLAEFYKIDIVRSLGLLPADNIATEISTMTRAYAGNPAVLLPVTELAGGHWHDNDVQGVPYNRGFMYFADLDRRLREHGSVNIDELVRDISARRLAGAELGNDDWRALLAQQEIPGIVEHFDAMLAGEIIALAADTFGPELELESVAMHRRRLGFDERALTPLPNTIASVHSGSPAAAAGLRDGDTLLAAEGIAFSSLHSSPGVIVSDAVQLRIERDGREHDIEFEPAVERRIGQLCHVRLSTD